MGWSVLSGCAASWERCVSRERAKRELSGRVGRVRRGADKAVHGIDRVGPGSEGGWCSYTERSLPFKESESAGQLGRLQSLGKHHSGPSQPRIWQGARKSSSSHHWLYLRCRFFSVPCECEHVRREREPRRGLRTSLRNVCGMSEECPEHVLRMS